MPIVGSNILTCMASKKIFLPIIMNSLPAIKMFTTRRGVIWAPLMAPGKPSHPGYSRRQGSSREHAIFVKESALVGFIMLSYCDPSFYNQRMFSHKKSSLKKCFKDVKYLREYLYSLDLVRECLWPNGLLPLSHFILITKVTAQKI